jgi:RimJ/RimL family protein N-acetyltransferase
MKFIENTPLNTKAIDDLITTKDDLHLVWPLAKYPFDHNQWKKVLDPAEGNKSFFFYADNRCIGHAALRITDNPCVYAVSFLYLIPAERSKGLGQKMIGMIEQYAHKNLSASRLVLVVRTYNPKAIKCYLKSGFKEESRAGTLIRMSKSLQRTHHKSQNAEKDDNAS